MYGKGAQGWVKHLDFMILDIACLNVAFLLAYFIRHGLSNPYESHLYCNMAIVLTLIEILIVILFGSLKNVLKRGYYKEFSMTVKHVCLVELLATFYLFSVQENDYSRIVLYLMGIIYVVLSYITRIGWKLFLKKKMTSVGKRSLLIITSEQMAEEVVDNIRQNNYEMFRIAGIVVIDQDLKGTIINGEPVVANCADVVEYVCRKWVDEVLFDLPEEVAYPDDLNNQFIEMGIVVHIKLIKASGLIGQKNFVERLGNYTVLTTSINYATPGQLFIKRSMDIVGGVMGCVMTALLFVVLAPLIYLQSPGPIFFQQERVGMNGKHFQMYKFRSMYLDAEERKAELLKQNRVKDGMMFKLDYDPRIIGCRRLPDGTIKKGIGNYIRDWSLDEFPQFINVLKGDMSLVGTRPPTVDEWEKYELHHRARLATKPGITGLWQVSGRSNITSFEKVVELDTQYIREWNMGLDFRILLKTVQVVLGKTGSM